MSEKEMKENVQAEQPADAVHDTAEATYEREEETSEGAGEAEASTGSAELEALRKQAEENYERYLRTQADFDNFRRRSRQEKEEFAKYASSKLVEQLLPVVDNFERALASAGTGDIHSLLKGVEMIYRQLDQVLEQEGLKRMDSIGQPFNPDVHQAIQQVESAEHEEGTVVEEVQKGYIFKDKVLRPAMVKVSM